MWRRTPKKKIINVNYLIIALIKMRLLMFLLFSQYELAFTLYFINTFSNINIQLHPKLDFLIPCIKIAN